MSFVIAATPSDGQLNDCIVEVVGTQFNDGLLAWYHSYGATSPDLNDAAFQFLSLQGVIPGDINDMWFDFLTMIGYTGSLNDMLTAFWCNDGGDLGEVPLGFNYGLYVGWNDGFLYGYRPPFHPTNSFGRMIPNGELSGKVVYQFGVNTGNNNVTLSLGPNGDEFISGVGSIILDVEGYTGTQVELIWNIDNDRYETTSAEMGAHFKAWHDTTPTEPMGVSFILPVMDLDGDGKPDVILRDGRSDGSITITEDEDSINVDLDNDGDADITFPK